MFSSALVAACTAGYWMVITALFAAVAYTTIDFWGLQRTAGKMMLPYLIFVGYANALNYNFWVNNQDVSANLFKT
jgi:tryptophan-rich sensory protein